MERSDLITQLGNGTVKVVFKKVDGSMRTMICTKRTDVIPTEALPKGQRSTLDRLCTVWDLEAKGWRSFNFDSVVEYEAVEN